MNRSILVACACAAALAGCGRTIVREERVVEQPVYTPSTVVEHRAIVVPETVATAPAACDLSGNLYSSGTYSCQGTYEYRCTNGVWERVAGSSC